MGRHLEVVGGVGGREAETAPRAAPHLRVVPDAPCDTQSASRRVVRESLHTVKSCKVCHLLHTDESWAMLKHIGDQHLPADEWEPALTLSLHNCWCGSTLAVEVLPE